MRSTICALRCVGHVERRADVHSEMAALCSGVGGLPTLPRRVARRLLHLLSGVEPSKLSAADRAHLFVGDVDEAYRLLNLSEQLRAELSAGPPTGLASSRWSDLATKERKASLMLSRALSDAILQQSG